MTGKAQVSVFIIFAIVLVVLIAIFFIFRGNIISVEQVNPQVLPVYSFAENCVKKTAEDAIYHISATGGYFYPANISTKNSVAYYLYGKNNLMPKRESIEKELGDYMNEMLFFCSRGFQDFKDFKVTQSDVKSSVKILDGKVVFEVNYPLSIEKDNKTFSVSSFKTEIPVNLQKVYSAAGEIMEEQMTNTEVVCMSCIGKISVEKYLYIDMYDYEKNKVIFIIVDRNSKINNKELEFFFANEY